MIIILCPEGPGNPGGPKRQNEGRKEKGQKEWMPKCPKVRIKIGAKETSYMR